MRLEKAFCVEIGKDNFRAGKRLYPLLVTTTGRFSD